MVTAQEAVAKARAGSRDPIAPRTDGRGRNHDNVPDVSVHLLSIVSPLPTVVLVCFGYRALSCPGCIRSTDDDFSYESILLKPGERKISEEVDTRELPGTVTESEQLY